MSPPNRKSSSIWEYCEDVGQLFAKCTLCNKRLSYRSSITNIKRHLARKHPEVCQYVAGTTTVTAIPGDQGDLEFVEIADDDDGDVVEEDGDPGIPGGGGGEGGGIPGGAVVTVSCGTFQFFPKPEATSDLVQIESFDGKEDESESSLQNGRKRKHSDIWQYFTPLDSQMARCGVCEVTLSYKTSISNLKRHLARKHNIDQGGSYIVEKKLKDGVIVEDVSGPISTDQNEIEPAEAVSVLLHDYSQSPEVNIADAIPTDQPATQESPTQNTQRADDPIFNPKEFDRKLMEFFVKDYQSLRIIDELGFQFLIKTLNPTYVIPTRQELVRSLSSAYNLCLEHMRKQVGDIIQCCLTTDCWRSEYDENYLSVTVHYIDEKFEMISILLDCVQLHQIDDISKELKQIVEEWGIEEKISVAVTDIDDEMQRAIGDLEWNNIGCFAHTVDSLVQDAMVIVESFLEKIKGIVRYLKIDKMMWNDDRWLSILSILKRFVEMEETVRNFTFPQGVEISPLTSEEWTTIHELCQILKPFETVVDFLCTERYVPASLVIVLTKELDDALTSLISTKFGNLPNEVLAALRLGLVQLGNVETVETLALCTYLDPRFKNFGFSTSEAADAIKEHLVDLLSTKVQELPSQSNGGTKSTSSIWQSFQKRVSECRQPGSEKSKVLLEVERYLEEELVDQGRDPLEWWGEFKGRYPRMSAVAREVLCALGTTIPSERVFGRGGHTLMSRRKRLRCKEVKALTVLNGNWELFNEKF